MHPKDVSARLYNAAALRLSGNLNAADDALQQARDAPKSVFPIFKFNYELFNAQAFVDQVWERYDLAKTSYEQALAWCPTCGQILRNIGEIALERGDKNGAEEYLRRAVRLTPEDSCARNLLNYVHTSESKAAVFLGHCAVAVR
jgi:tetratricopeptide (TPR) repeat protein